MTIAVAYWCVLAAALLPYLWVGIAKAGGARFDNRDPRAWLARQEDPRRQRATAAQLNAFEAFPAFAAGVLVAHSAGVAPVQIAVLAGVFIAARVLHGVLYLANLATLRSIAWFIGLACVVTLLVLGARAAA